MSTAIERGKSAGAPLPSGSERPAAPGARTPGYALGLAALALALSGPAGAVSARLDEQGMVRRADLVFEGVVERVEYAFSDAQGGIRPRLPHTFVTYRIENVIRGAAAADTITLRFLGGRGEQAAFLMISGLPLFDVGDRDVLLVAHNTQWGCPLVDCAAGRLRLIQGRVFSEEGQSVELDSDGALALGAHYDLPEVMTHQVSRTELRRRDHFESGESREPFVEPGSGAQLTRSELLARLRAAASAAPASLARVRSAEAAQPFALEPSPAAPPPAERAAIAQPGADPASVGDPE